MTRYLVVSATRAEAAHVPAELPVLITGIGKTAAATALTRALMQTERTGPMVLNIGTAGALHDDHAGLYLPGRVLNHDISAAALRTLGYDPQDDLVVPGGDRTVLASGDTFVTEPETRERLAARADLVDMEGYAVAYVGATLGVPVRLIKHVSDQADAGAMDWPQLVDHSAVVLGSWLRDLLAAKE